MLTHIHKVMITCWCWHICKGGGVCAVEMGLGPSLPLALQAQWDSVLFVEVKCIFSTTLEAEIFSKSSWIETEANGGRWGNRTLNQTWSQHDRMRLVSGSSSLAQDARALPVGHGTDASGQALEKLQSSRGRSDAVARPVTIDRTRQVASGCLLEMTGERIKMPKRGGELGFSKN
jgi:hypothetical protein